jgi:hypothetical protein
MKNLRTLVLCTCLMLFSLFSTAQVPNVPINEPNYNKPRLFDNLPAVIPISIGKLNSLLNSNLGTNINTTLSTDAVSAPFQGNVVSVSRNDDSRIQSVTIKSTNYNGATLSISRVTADDRTITYNGRLMSFQHGDLYLLQQKDNGFILVKKNFYDLVNE